MNEISFKIKYLNFRNILILLSFLAAVIVLIFLLTGSTSESAVQSNNFTTSSMFLKNNTLYYLSQDFKKIKLSENTDILSTVSSTGDNLSNIFYNTKVVDHVKIIYFITFSSTDQFLGTLYKYEENKGIEKIDENVYAALQISDDEKSLAYFKVNGDWHANSPSETLYIYNSGIKTKISDNFSQFNMLFSGDSKTIFYVDVDSNNNNVILYEKKLDGTKTKIDSSDNLSLIYASKDGTYVIYSKYSDTNRDFPSLYIKKQGHSPELITFSSFTYVINKKNLGIYYIGDYKYGAKTGDLFYKAFDKKSIKLDVNVNSFVYASNTQDDLDYYYNSDKILYTKNTSSISNIYYINNFSSPIKLFSPVDEQGILISSLKNNVLYNLKTNSKDLSIKKVNIENKKAIITTKVFKDESVVMNSGLSNDPNYQSILTSSNNKLYSLNLKNNIKTLIGDFSNNISFYFYSNNVFYYVDENNLYKKVSGKKPEKIFDNIAGIKLFSKGKFLISKKTSVNGLYDLYTYEEKKPLQTLETGVSRVILDYTMQQ